MKWSFSLANMSGGNMWKISVSKDITYEYISDYDFLVVTKNNPEKSYVKESIIASKAEKFIPPVNLEIH